MGLINRLFALDDPDHYDKVTGQELPDRQQTKADEFLAQAIEDAEALKSLEANKGWKIVRGLIVNDMERKQEDLLQCLNPALIPHMQEFIKTRRTLLGWIDGKILEANTLLEEQKARNNPSQNG